MNRILLVLMLTLTSCLSTQGAVNLLAPESAVDPTRAITPEIPSLDELAGNWWPRTELEQFPSIYNFAGRLAIDKDFASVSWLASPPYSQGFHSGALKLNGQTPAADKFRWFPYQAVRAGATNGLAIETVNRMVFDARGVMWRISVSNTQAAVQNARLTIDLIGDISKLTAPGAWGRTHSQPGVGGAKFRYQEIEALRKNLDANPPPRFATAANYHAALAESGTIVLIADTKSPARTAFGFAQKPDALTTDGQVGVAAWDYRLAPGETRTVEFVMAFGEGDSVAADAVRWANQFDSTFADAKKLWEKRYAEAFTPGNGYFEGNLPVLVTADPALRRNYYMGVITLLLMLNDQNPGYPRVFSSGGPRNGPSVQFIWDTGMMGTLFAQLEPKVMKAYLIQTLQWNLDQYFFFDYYGRRAGGWQYAANYPALFRLASSYLRITGDRAVLNERVGKGTFLEQIDRLALNYKRYLSAESGLADFGGDTKHFLECVPTYVHATAGLNAAYVDMLREMAELYDSLGRSEQAKERRADAAQLAGAIRQLYVPGGGYWQALFPDGQRIDIRHCLDFQYVAQSIADDLSPTVRKEMRDFVVRELFMKNWMRAQSLQDPAASGSFRMGGRTYTIEERWLNRPDHTTIGAYSGWPPETVDGLCNLGYWQDALDFYRRCEAATHEGAFSQGHVFYGPNPQAYDAPVRIADAANNCRESLCGADFADVVIRAFFGVRPDFSGKNFIWKRGQARGFAAELRHVRIQGQLYTLTSDAQGIHHEKE